MTAGLLEETEGAVVAGVVINHVAGLDGTEIEGKAAMIKGPLIPGGGGEMCTPCNHSHCSYIPSSSSSFLICCLLLPPRSWPQCPCSWLSGQV